MTDAASGRALVVLHDHASSGGFVSERLWQRGWQVEEMLVVPPERFGTPSVSASFPDPRDFDLLVPTGAPWSAYDDAAIGSWLQPELRWLRQADEVGTPVFGICFGAQALARALGGRVERAPAPEIGWTAIETSAPELVGPGPWFQWHYDRLHPPAGAEVIARTALAVQAFRYGPHLGVQFHPEVTADGVGIWLDNGGNTSARAAGLDPDQLRRDCASEESAARRRAHALVDAWLAVGAAAEPA